MRPGLVGIGASYSPRISDRYGAAILMTICLGSGAAVIALTVMTGGLQSGYHQALYVVMFAFALLPLTWQPKLTALIFVLILLGYNLAIAAFTPSPLDHFAIWLTHGGLLFCAMFVAVVLYAANMRSRYQEFVSRGQLEAANQRLKELDRAKSRFFANLSHELRTPLTLTLAPVEIMLEDPREPLSTGQAEKLTLIKRNSLRLLRLVDDLLALTRAEAASLRLKLESVDVSDFVGKLVDEVSDLSSRKRIEVRLEVPDDLPVIQVDPTLVERVLLNLFGNAAKFTGDGGKITVALRALTEGGVAISVTDTGIGIPAHALPHVFDRFYQADDTSTRQFGGTDIGLALAREIVELHGGTIVAESTLGVGTTIRFTLPLEPPPDAPIERRRARRIAGQERRAQTGLPEWDEALRSARSYRLQEIDDATERRIAPRSKLRGRAPTILIVEDNRDMIQFLVALLASEFNTMTATDGVQGLRTAIERRPDLIVSDVMMPEMDGFEMVRRMRESPEAREIPVIMLTARGAADDRIAGRKGGAETYLTKPFRAEELLAAIHALLERQSAQREVANSDLDEALDFLASGVTDTLTAAANKISTAIDVFAAPRLGAGGIDGRDDLRLKSALDGASSGLSELLGTIHELRHFAFADVGGAPVAQAINDVVRRVLELVAQTAFDRQVSADLGSRSRVRFPEGSLERVILHLVLNALDVTPPGGTVRLQTADDPDGYAVVTIEDQGPGIPARHSRQVFFPYYSTQPGELPGMGLAVSRRIVESQGGSIFVEQSEGGGATFVLRLPSLAPVSST